MSEELNQKIIELSGVFARHVFIILILNYLGLSFFNIVRVYLISFAIFAGISILISSIYGVVKIIIEKDKEKN